MPALAHVLATRPGQPVQIEALRCLALTLSSLPARRPDGNLAMELARLVGNTTDEQKKRKKTMMMMKKKSAASSGSGDGDADGDGDGWLGDLRGGLASVLRAKAPREMRLTALDLCAAAADLAGPRWLCGADPTPNSPSFFRLTLELTRVETAVLLHDLTRDDAELRARARKFLPVPLVAYERLVAALAADSEAAAEEEEAEEEFPARRSRRTCPWTPTGAPSTRSCSCAAPRASGRPRWRTWWPNTPGTAWWR